MNEVRVEVGADGSVLFADMRNANDSINVREASHKHLVSPHLAKTMKTHERVVGKNDLESHSASVEDGFQTEIAQSCMGMDDIDLFSDEHLAKKRK